MASHGSGGDSDSYSDGPEESGYRDAFVSEVFIVDANPGEGGRSTPATATTTPGAPTEGTARGERGADAPPGDASQPDLTTPEGRGAVRDVLAGLWPAPATPAEDKAKVLTGTAVTRQLRVQVIKEEPRLISKACPYPSHKVVKGPDFKHKGRLGQHQQAPPRQTGEQAWRSYREQGMHASLAPIVSSGVQVKTEQPQPLGQSSLASVQEHGQPTQGGQGQQGLGGYGPQLSDPYPGQPYGLSSQSTQQANPFATGATSTPTPTTQYNAPYGGTAYGVTTSAAPSVKMPQTAIASYGGISVANMQRAGFGFANPFSQLAGQAPPILPAPQQPQQPVWTGQTQPSPQPQAWQGQMGANVNSPSSAKVEPPQSSRSSLAGQQSYGGVPGYGSNGNPYVNSNEKQPVFGMPSSIKNAVRMIQPFYSDGATVEKARAFSFEMTMVGLNATIRLSAFRECLKGKTGEYWWMYSQISDFETLRRRFHEQFICQTPLQMIERLKSTKRTKGMSAEVWEDLISSLCNAAHCYDEQMRYQ
ncbi:hypothetical protein PF010_g2169 [Phytophthora fragariae]|uniref:Retrotransposon gag domain-containing protein n=1 Tax=Phytophthora fragariae TaxID=53985 RepID=A0A6G0LXS3_9STRA|nr:hypothetical protein PF010_g2169 [Phytophthora fragariae]